MRILLVEDEPSVRKVTARMLEADGHAVLFAETAAGATRLLVTEEVDVVLLDIQLGDANYGGFEVSHFIRADPQLRGLPVIVLSGMDPDNVRTRARSNALEGVSYFFQKPLVGEEWSRLKRVLASIGHEPTIIPSAPPTNPGSGTGMRILTDGGDPDDPAHREIDPASGQQRSYVALSAEERAKGFVRPVRRSYVHEKCGSVTTMATALAETYARQPDFYAGTFCARCKDHFPVGADGEFTWDDGTDQKVGT